MLSAVEIDYFYANDCLVHLPLLQFFDSLFTDTTPVYKNFIES